MELARRYDMRMGGCRLREGVVTGSWLAALAIVGAVAGGARAQCSGWSVAEPGPPPQTDPAFGLGMSAMAHDPARGTTWGIAYNNVSATTGCVVSLYRLIGSTWQVAPGALPAGLCSALSGLTSGRVAMAFDSSRDVVVVAAASSPGGVQVWDFDGQAWTARGSAGGTSILLISGFCVDPVRERLVLMSGSEIWEWANGAWTRGPDAPGASANSSGGGLSFDALRGRAVAYLPDLGGGFEGWADYTPGAASGTGSWGSRVVTPPTQGVIGALTAYDPAGGSVVRVGGRYGVCDYTPTTALVAPDNWPNANSFKFLAPFQFGSSGRAGSSICFDPSRGPDGGVLVSGGAQQVCTNGGPPVTFTRFSDTQLLSLARPTITQQPSSNAVCTGSTAALTVGAGSASTLRYQWFKRAPGEAYYSPIAGATAFIHPNGGSRTPGDTGDYVCLVGDDCGWRLSQSASLIVRDPPGVGVPNWSSTVACPGGSVQIAVPGVAGTDVSVVLQKRVDLSTWQDVAFATPGAPTISLTNLGAGDTGEYRVQVRNACGEANSRSTRLQVGAAITGAIGVVGTVGPCNAITIRAQPGLDVAGASAVGTLTLRWYKDGAALADDGRVTGAGTSSLSIASLGYVDAGVYELRATDSACAGEDRKSITLSLPEPQNAYVARDPNGPRPAARQYHAMAYDAGRGVTVLYGGLGRDQFGQSVALGDTWEFDGTVWAQRTPANSPGLLYSHAMVYDSVRQRVLLYGGSAPLCATACAAPPRSQVWEWDGANWSLRWTFSALGGPIDSRAPYPGLAYDPVAQRMVLYTGSNPPSDIYQGQTWEFDPAGGTWSQRSGAGPTTGNGSPSMYFDVARGKRVMYLLGAFSTVPSTIFPGLYEWDGSQWLAAASDLSGAWQFNQQAFPATSSATNTWAYNTLTRRGESGLMTVTPPGGGGLNSGTYTYAGPPGDPVRVSWQNGYGLVGGAQVWDSARRCMVIFGGQNQFPGASGQGLPTNSLIERHFAEAPRVLDQPFGVSRCWGSAGAVSLRVVATGAPSLGYQWQKNSPQGSGTWVGVVDVPGQVVGSQSTRLQFTGSVDPRGVYRCVVGSSSCGSVVSENAAVTVCIADFDCSGVVAVQDIFEFINAWFVGDARADVDGVPGLSVADIFGYLNLWFAGC